MESNYNDNAETIYSISEECRTFVEGLNELQVAYGASAFHDSVLSHFEYQLSGDGRSFDIIISLSIDGEVEVTLKFVRVHGIEINLPDIRCATRNRNLYPSGSISSL